MSEDEQPTTINDLLAPDGMAWLRERIGEVPQDATSAIVLYSAPGISGTGMMTTGRPTEILWMLTEAKANFVARYMTDEDDDGE